MFNQQRERRDEISMKKLHSKAVWSSEHVPLLKVFIVDEHGSYLVEAALVLSLYLTVIFAMMSVGVILFAYGNSVYASRLAVRYAIVHSSSSSNPCTSSVVQGLVQPYLWGAPAGGVNVTTHWSPSNTVGSTFSVTITLSFQTSLPLVSANALTTTTTAQGFILH